MTEKCRVANAFSVHLLLHFQFTRIRKSSLRTIRACPGGAATRGLVLTMGVVRYTRPHVDLIWGALRGFSGRDVSR